MRENGVVRFLLGSSPEEVEASRPYMGLARTQLGITKNLMKLGGLPSYTRTVELEDGTIIRCQSVMGQDAIAIVPVMRVPARPRQVEEIVALPPKKKITRTSKTEYAWLRLPDGPPKHGHEIMWDWNNQRLLVWSGYDRTPLPEIPVQPGYAPISHADNTLLGWHVSQIKDYTSLGGYPAINWSLADLNSRALVFTGPHSTNPAFFTGEAAAIQDKHGGVIGDWSSYNTVYFGYNIPDYYGYARPANSIIEHRDTYDPASYLATYVVWHPGYTIWDVYGRAPLPGGEARYFWHVNFTNSTFNGMEGNNGGSWLNAADSTIGYVQEYAPLAELYLDGDSHAHADGHVRKEYQTWDLLLSNQLWQFEFTAGMPWTADPTGATTGVWTRLADISYNEWQSYGGSTSSLSSGAGPEGMDATNHVPWTWALDFWSDALGDFYPGYTEDDFGHMYFGGTITGADTSMSAQLWLYGPVVTVTEVEEDGI